MPKKMRHLHLKGNLIISVNVTIILFYGWIIAIHYSLGNVADIFPRLHGVFVMEYILYGWFEMNCHLLLQLLPPGCRL